MSTSRNQTLRDVASLGLSAALLTAALALGGAVFGGGTAVAEPREWDIGAYDACTNKAEQDWLSGKISWPAYLELRRGCCSTSGGIVEPSGNGGFKCVAPPAEAESRPIHPGVATPPVAASQNPTPPPPITRGNEPVHTERQFQ